MSSSKLCLLSGCQGTVFVLDSPAITRQAVLNCNVMNSYVAIIGYCDLIADRLAKFVSFAVCRSRSCDLLDDQVRIRIFCRNFLFSRIRIDRFIVRIKASGCCSIQDFSSQDIRFSDYVCRSKFSFLSGCQGTVFILNSPALTGQIVLHRNVVNSYISVISYRDLVADRLAKFVSFTISRCRCCHLLDCQVRILLLSRDFHFSRIRIDGFVIRTFTRCRCLIEYSAIKNIRFSDYMCRSKFSTCTRFKSTFGFVDSPALTSQAVIYCDVMDSYVSIIGYCDLVADRFTKLVSFTVSRSRCSNLGKGKMRIHLFINDVDSIIGCKVTIDLFFFYTIFIFITLCIILIKIAECECVSIPYRSCINCLLFFFFALSAKNKMNFLSVVMFYIISEPGFRSCNFSLTCQGINNLERVAFFCRTLITAGFYCFDYAVGIFISFLIVFRKIAECIIVSIPYRSCFNRFRSGTSFDSSGNSQCNFFCVIMGFSTVNPGLCSINFNSIIDIFNGICEVVATLFGFITCDRCFFYTISVNIALAIILRKITECICVVFPGNGNFNYFFSRTFFSTLPVKSQCDLRCIIMRLATINPCLCSRNCNGFAGNSICKIISLLSGGVSCNLRFCNTICVFIAFRIEFVQVAERVIISIPGNCSSYSFFLRSCFCTNSGKC